MSTMCNDEIEEQKCKRAKEGKLVLSKKDVAYVMQYLCSSQAYTRILYDTLDSLRRFDTLVINAFCWCYLNMI